MVSVGGHGGGQNRLVVAYRWGRGHGMLGMSPRRDHWSFERAF